MNTRTKRTSEDYKHFFLGLLIITFRVVFFPLNLIWILFIKYPKNYNPLIGWFRFAAMVFICMLLGKDLSGIGHYHDIEMFLTQYMSSGVAKVLIAFVGGFCGINAIAQLMVAGGLYRNYTPTSGEIQKGPSTGYKNIDEGLEYLDGMLEMQSTRGKVNMLGDIFSGKKKL